MSARTYPERRFYAWRSVPNHTYKQARRIFMLLRGPRGMPARVATLDAVLEALALLHERGVTNYPGEKLHALFVRCAQANAWYTANPNKYAGHTKQKAAPEGMRGCIRCKRLKPAEVFVTQASEAQCRAYGWSYNGKRRIPSTLCDTCRVTVRNARRKRDAQARAKATRSPQMVQVLDVIRKHYFSVYQFLRRNATLPAPLADFYWAKQRLLKVARERALDGHLPPEDTPSNWLGCLPPEDAQELTRLYIAALPFWNPRGRKLTL